MRKTALVIMAAGIGSRFGDGIKQLERIDEGQHIIMDYSVHDAVEAGFEQIVFVIRKDIEAEFKEIIGSRIEKVCQDKGVKVDYCFQNLGDVPGEVPEGRMKPWGTGQAVLAAKNLIDSPFAIINADDYYGKRGFEMVHDFLAENEDDNCQCMAGFVLKNTLSDNGGVTRGVCMIKDGELVDIRETHKIVKMTADDGSLSACSEEGLLDLDSLVSMNMWGFGKEFMESLEKGFEDFFVRTVPADPLKSEFLVPEYVGALLNTGEIRVKVLKTDDTWYGMTYKEDVLDVKANFAHMISEGVYTAALFD